MLTAADNRDFSGDWAGEGPRAEASADIPIWDFGSGLVSRAGSFARFGTKPRPILKMAIMYTLQSTQEII
jgi:hypothetical protein